MLQVKEEFKEKGNCVGIDEVCGKKLDRMILMPPFLCERARTLQRIFQA